MTNHDLVARVFPRLRQVGFSLSSHWLIEVFSFLLIGLYDYLGSVLRNSIKSTSV